MVEIRRNKVVINRTGRVLLGVPRWRGMAGGVKAMKCDLNGEETRWKCGRNKVETWWKYLEIK